ncbi:extracellular solute-binding protein [Microbacterium sp. 18062]|uniref:extracellular solute-binding protein n=1 Tax=Microbacterium sp. 18062 TaxID=2681410 RepID=UPI0013578F06|nr:extracellular solute-binding protein [Microbacterium sp. 18062]
MNALRSRATRRTLLVTGAALTAAIVLAGCGRASETGGTSATVTIDDEPATGTIEFWAGGADGEALPDFLAEFQEENPDVEINVTTIPEGDNDAKLSAAIAAGNVPDMVYLYSQTQAAMLDTGAFAEVPDGLVESADFFSSMWDTVQYDGAAHAVPWYTYAQALYYRKDLAAAAGVEAPETWEDYATFSEAVQDQGATFGVGLSAEWDGYTAQQFNDFVRQAGGSLISDDLTEWTIDTPENLEALETYAGLVTDGYASPDGPSFLDTVSWFTSGEIASYINGPWFPGWLEEANGEGWNEDNLGIALVPAGPAGTTSALGGGSLAVLEDGKNTEAAWKLVRWLSEPDTQVAWYETFGNLPAVEAAWDAPAIADDPLLDVIKEAIPLAGSVPAVPGWSEVSAMLGAEMERVARGQATAAEVLAAAQAKADEIPTGVE